MTVEKDVGAVRRFLGCSQFYRRWIALLQVTPSAEPHPPTRGNWRKTATDPPHPHARGRWVAPSHFRTENTRT
jgi:hypothetical protein